MRICPNRHNWTRISGSVATNITPVRCELTIELRSIGENHPERELTELLANASESEAEMQERAQGTGFEWRRVLPARQLVMRATAPHIDRLTTSCRGRVVRFPKDPRVAFSKKTGGIPSFIIGPGSIEQVRQPDEFIEVNQVENCIRFLSSLVQESVLFGRQTPKQV